jgi:hypothetical protein
VVAHNQLVNGSVQRRVLGHIFPLGRSVHDLFYSQVRGLAAMKGKPKEEKPKSERQPKIVRNLMTGVEWPWNPIYKGNADLEVIEWE